MDSFELQLNDLLVRVYRSIERMEERMLQSMKGLNLTISEIHLLETVGFPKDNPEGKTISDISEQLQISLPTATLAVNKLVKKQYVEKRRSESDGRKVHVLLTREGIKANRLHHYFHRKMVAAISQTMSEPEKAALLKGMLKLNRFFEENTPEIK